MKSIIDYTNKLKSFFAEKQALSNQIDAGYLKNKNLWSCGNVFVTLSEQVDIDIAAGSYVLSANVVSSDTDASTCVVIFLDENSTSIVQYQMTRGTSQSVNVTLSRASKAVRFYASDNYNHSSGDTASFTNIMLSTEGGAYVPYAPSNLELLSYKDNGVLGAKNLLNASSTSETITANTNNRATFGSISLKAGDAVIFSLRQTTTCTSVTRNTIELEDASANHYYENQTTDYAMTAGVHEYSFVAPTTSVYTFKVWCNTANVNMTYTEPMVRYAFDTDPTYQPYAMTNKELTDALTVEDYTSQITSAIEGLTFNIYSSLVLKCHNIVQLNLVFEGSGTIAEYTNMFNLPDALKAPTRNSGYRVLAYNDASTKPLIVNPYSGKVTSPQGGITLTSGIAYRLHVVYII